MALMHAFAFFEGKKNPRIFRYEDFQYGRGKGIRTPDILLPKQARYRTALYPGKKKAPSKGAFCEQSFWRLILRFDPSVAGFKNGGSCGIRTYDQLVKSQLLYQLS
jgi:hypothetical protein